MPRGSEQRGAKAKHPVSTDRPQQLGRSEKAPRREGSRNPGKWMAYKRGQLRPEKTSNRDAQ